MFKERKDALFKGLLTLFGGIVLLNTIKTNQLLKREINKVKYGNYRVIRGRMKEGGARGAAVAGLGRALTFNDSEKEKQQTRSELRRSN